MDSKQALRIIKKISNNPVLANKKLSIHPSTIFSERLNGEEKIEYVKLLFEEGLSSCIKYEDVYTIINKDLLLKYGVFPRLPPKTSCRFSTPSEHCCYFHDCDQHGVNAYHKYPLVVFACDIHYHFYTPDIKDTSLKNAFYNQVEKCSGGDKSWGIFPLSKQSDVVKWGVQRASAYGHLNILKWLINTFQLTCVDQRLFQLASGNGHLDVLKWLTVTFQMKAIDARADNNCAFRWASGNGHLDVLKWLTFTFQLSDIDVRSNNNCALRWAKKSRHLDVVNWLTITFPNHNINQ